MTRRAPPPDRSAGNLQPGAGGRPPGEGAHARPAQDRPRPLPLGVRLLVTAFVAALVPAYVQAYGPAQFLWMSDVALLVTLVAVWRTSPLLNGALVLGPLPFELIWNLDFWPRLLTGAVLFDLTAYMFDPALPLPLRALSLFHAVLPPLWLALLVRWGHPRGALAAAVVLHVTVVVASLLLTEPADDVNFVFAPARRGWDVPQPLWAALVLALPPLLLSWPLHRLLRRLRPG